MRIRHSARSDTGKIQLQMTPMIDIVFQLLVFFTLTFKIGAAEGDFNVKMPLAAAAGAPNEGLIPPMRVRLVAKSDGQIARIELGERALPSFAALRDEIMAIVGANTGPESLAASAEVELDCDYQLKYEHVIDAITAISGYIERVGDSERQVKLIERIKFAPPRQPQGPPG